MAAERLGVLSTEDYMSIWKFLNAFVFIVAIAILASCMTASQQLHKQVFLRMRAANPYVFPGELPLQQLVFSKQHKKCCFAPGAGQGEEQQKTDEYTTEEPIHIGYRNALLAGTARVREAFTGRGFLPRSSR
ncbi:hypothetical protein [Spirochaeta dissipatitropha]